MNYLKTNHLKRTAALILLISYYADAFAQTVLPFESTVTYKCLVLDSEIIGSNSKEILFCKELMEKASERITQKYSPNSIPKLGIEDASEILGIIDRTFKEFGFHFNTDPTNLHYDILTRVFKDEYQDEYTGEKCRYIDCDEYCRIYIGISQMVNLPISMVHIPQHYYLRWHLSDSDYFSWNPNYAKVHIDETSMELYYKLPIYNSTWRVPLLPRQLNTEEVFGNYCALWGDIFWSNDSIINVSKTREISIKAIKTGYISTSLFNNYVWLYIMHPELDPLLDFDELYSLIDKAIYYEEDGNYYDAKACLLAMQGDFNAAILIENEGLSKRFYASSHCYKALNHLDCFQQNKVCRTIK